MMKETKQQNREQPLIENSLRLFLIIFIISIIGGLVPKKFFYYGPAFIPILFILPILVLTKRENLDIIKTLNIKKINYQLVILSIIIGVIGLFIAAYLDKLLVVVGKLYEFEGLKTPENTFENFSSIILAVVLAPLFEEFVFRGYILNSFKKFGFIQAIILSAFLFSVIHGPISRVIAIGFLGLIFGYLVYRTGSIYSSILAHAANNAMARSINYYSHLQNFDKYTELYFVSILVIPAILLMILSLKLLIKETPSAEVDKIRLKEFWSNIKSLFKIKLFRIIILIFLITISLEIIRIIL